MRTRRLGTDGPELTTIGLGTWAIGGSDWRFGWGPHDDDEAVAALVAGVDRGVNWIDTAAIYGDGHAEELTGRALRELGPSRRPFVATKCSRIMQADGTPRGCLKRASVHAECEASLRRLGVDVLDLYQVHWPDPDEDIEEGWAAVAELIDAGKVRFGGVSNFDVGQLRRAQGVRRVQSQQPPYHMFRRDVEAEVLPFCAEHGIGVVAYSPMAKGLLTGAFTAERAAALPDDDHRSRDPEFLGERLAANLRVVDGLRALAADLECTVAELAIAWVLRRPEVTSAIVGVRRPDQLDGILRGGDVDVDAACEQAIEALLAARD